MKKQILFIGTLALLVGFTGCAKLIDKEQIKSTTNPLLKTYFGSFKSGSTWTYQSSTGGTETVNVKQYRDQEPILAVLLNSSENTVIQLNTSFDETSISYYGSSTYIVTHRITAINNNIKVTQDPKEVKVRVDILPTYKVNGVIYNDVIHSTDENDPYYREFYFAKNMGIIEKVASGDARYKLQSFEIK